MQSTSGLNVLAEVPDVMLSAIAHSPKETGILSHSDAGTVCYMKPDKDPGRQRFQVAFPLTWFKSTCRGKTLNLP